MAKITISINGKPYPCYQTMGAMLRFKQETGKEVTEIDGSVTDMCTYLYCCIKSAAQREGTPFEMDLMTFADNINAEDVAAWANVISEPMAEDDAKGKTKKKNLK